MVRLHTVHNKYINNIKITTMKKDILNLTIKILCIIIVAVIYSAGIVILVSKIDNIALRPISIIIMYIIGFYVLIKAFKK